MDPADEVCQNTTSLLYVLSLHDNATWHMVHLINAGASQQLAISFDEHDFWVVSADGAFVMPQKAQVSSSLTFNPFLRASPLSLDEFVNML